MKPPRRLPYRPVTIRYRKNVDCLTVSELHDLREALAAMYLLPITDPHSFALHATFHGGPPTTYCRHGAPGFFTWHRAEMKAFEDALQAAGCHVMLPFWDWSSGPSTGVPAACSQPTYVNRSGTTVANPLYSGPRYGGGWTARSGSIATTAFDDLATAVQAATGEPSFTTFQSLINGPHGSVHGRVGGDMCCVPSASYDPLFFLHHANVDRIWARWQILHPGPLSAGEATFQLPPFNRPFTTQWQVGSDVESTDALGYRYQNLCFLCPPIKVWEIALIPWPPEVRERFSTARVLVKSTRMQEQAVEMRVFIDQPEARAGTMTIGNPRYAGALGFMGHGPAREVDAAHCPECAALGHDRDHAQHAVHHDHGDHMHDSRERFDIALDVSDALVRIGRDAKEFRLKLVALDFDGNPVPADKVLVDEIELVVD